MRTLLQQASTAGKTPGQQHLTTCRSCQNRWFQAGRTQPFARPANAACKSSPAEPSSALVILHSCSVVKPWYMSIDEEAEDVVGIAMTSHANITMPRTSPEHAAIGYRMPLKVRRQRPEGRLGDMESMQAWIAPSVEALGDSQRYDKIKRFVEQNAVRPLAGSLDTWSKPRQPAAPGWILSFDEEAMGSCEDGVLGSV